MNSLEVKTAPKKVLRSWAMYDWANSAYSLVITSTLFPIYFNAIATEDGNNDVQFLGYTFNSDSLQTYAISAAFLIIMLLSPLLSSIADYSGKKKKFMFFFSTMGAISCSLMYFFTGVETIYIGVFCSMLAAIGFAGSIVFYNAFLPEIAAPEDQDKVSAQGFALGYFGSSFLLIFCLTMVMFPQWYGNISAGMATRLSFLLVGIWWFGFAQITFRNVPELQTVNTNQKHLLSKGYIELKKVWSELKHTPRLKRFLLSFFFYNMATQTVMYVATLFGKSELKLSSEVLIAVILIIQFVAVPGAYLFSNLSKRFGNIIALRISIVCWTILSVAAYFCDKKYGFDEQTYFIVLAGCVGMVMGGIQSLSRSTYSKLLPETKDHASYFSFYDVCDKTGTVVGTFIFGYINAITGSMRNSIVVISCLFFLGLFLLSWVKMERGNEISESQ